MKSMMIYLISFFLFQPIFSQSPHIFQVTPENIELTALGIKSLLMDEGIPHPSLASLRSFLSIPNRNRVYKTTSSGCPVPGISVTEVLGGFNFQFNNFQGPNPPEQLFVAQMSNRGLFGPTFGPYGRQAFAQSIFIPDTNAEKRIFLVCSYCSNDNGIRTSSNWEVIIIEKSLL